MKRIISMLIALVMVVGIVPAISMPVQAVENTGGDFSRSFTTTEGKWDGGTTLNLIPTPTLPSYSTNSGADVADWQAYWNNTMVPAGWGSSYISLDDDALQVYQPTSEDTFAIRPTNTGTDGTNACLGGAGTAPDRYTGGVSYTVQLSNADMALANAGILKASAAADFFRELDMAYYHALTVEFYGNGGNKLGSEQNTYTAQTGAASGYMSRESDSYTVPAGTKYIRFWFCNYGTGDTRKSVRNFEAYLHGADYTLYLKDGVVTKDTANGEVLNGASYGITYSNGVYTFNNVNFVTTAPQAIKLAGTGSVTIKTVGANTVRSGNISSSYVSGDVLDVLSTVTSLTFNGSGSLNLIAGDSAMQSSHGICSSAPITVESGTITASAGNTPSGAYHSTGIQTYATMTVSGGTVTGIGGNGDYSYGIRPNDGITVSGGTVVGIAGTGPKSSVGIYVQETDAVFSFTNGIKVYSGNDESSATELSTWSGRDGGGYMYIGLPIHKHDSTTFTAWTATRGTVASGDYYLSGDVTATGSITVSSGTVNLCLNGHTLDMGSNRITVSSGATLNICDCSEGETGVIKSTHRAALDSSDKYSDTAGAINVFGNVTLSSGTVQNDCQYGRAIYVGSNANLTVSGGKVAITNSGHYAVFVGNNTLFGTDPAGTFTMTGGVIDTGTGYNNGTGVYISSGAVATVTGGKILVSSEGRCIDNIDSTLIIGGDAVINNTGEHCAIWVNANGSSATAVLHITGGTITATEKYAVGIAGGNGDTVAYLSGDPTITGKNSDISIYVEQDGTIKPKLYAVSEDGNTAYSGEALRLYLDGANRAQSGEVVVRNSTDTEKFTLANGGYKLEQSGENLAIATYGYGLWVGGVYVTEDNASDILGNGTASYNAETQTLYLENAVISGSYTPEDLDYAAGIYSSHALNIVISGTVNIHVENSNYGMGILIDGDLNIAKDPDSSSVTLNVIGDFAAAGCLDGGNITYDGLTVKGSAEIDTQNAPTEEVALSDGTFFVGSDIAKMLQFTYTVPHPHDETVYTAWTATGGTAVTSGHYYLTESNTTLYTSDIYIESDADVTLCLNGFTLDLGSRCLYLRSGSTLTICDCGEGGNITSEYSVIDNNGGTFVLQSGEVISTEGNCITNDAGDIIISGGTVNSYFFSGIDSTSDGVITVSGGEIISSDYDGIIIENSNGTANITGGTVQGYNCGISNYGGELTVSGGTVIGNTNRGIDNRGTLTVSGNAVISGVTGIYNLDATSSILGGSITGTQLGISNAEGTLNVSGGNISATDTNSCGIATNGTVHLYGTPVITGDESSYADIYISGGEFYAQSSDGATAYTGDALTVMVYNQAVGDVIISNASADQFTLVQKDGYTLKQDGTNLILAEKTVTAYNLWVGGVQVTSENADGITGDNITGTVTYDADTNTLTLNNATVKWAVVDTDPDDDENLTYPAGIYFEIDGLNIRFTGTNTIDATTETGHSPTAIDSNWDTYASLTLTGTDDTAKLILKAKYLGINFVKDLTINGNIESDNGVRSYGTIYVIGGSLLARNSRVAVRAMSGISIPTGYEILGSADETAELDSLTAASYSEYMQSVAVGSPDSEDYACTVLIAPAKPAHTHGETVYIELTDWAQLATSGNYYLGDTVPAVSGNITIASGVEITLCLNGKTLDLGSYYIQNNGTLTVCDCTESGKITADTTITSYGVVVNYGTFTMTSGTLERPNKAYGLENYGEATISGGTLYGASSGIRNRPNGSLTITGGTITCNNGYALQTDSEKDIIISDGYFSGKYALFTNPGSTGNIRISGGTFEGTGSGIYHQGAGTVYVSDGTITGKYGIYIYAAGNVNMSGGTITATNDYGIYNYNTGTVIFSGGEITAVKYGIQNNSTGSVEMTGGTVTGTSTSYAAIYNYEAGSVSISGGTINAKSSGITNRSSGSITFSGATMTTDGNGITNQSSGSVTVTGGTITSIGEVGIYGIRNRGSGTVTVSGGTIKGETFGISNCGVLYLSGSPSISNNSNGNGDILHENGSTLYAVDQNGNKYAGELLEIRVFVPSEGKEIVLKVDDSNKDKFTLVNTDGDYLLKQSGENLVLGLPHTHSWSADFATNETHHWHECENANCTVSENSEKNGYAEHNYVNGNCECGLHTHSWSADFTTNETHHWHECENTNCTVTENAEKSGYSEHNYVNGNCECGSHTHSWSADFTTNDTHHWHECENTNCTVTENSEKNGYSEHNYVNGNCECGSHTHDNGATVFEKLTATSGALASGNYYLAGNVTATGQITVANGETVTLCLNGNTLDLGSYNIDNRGTLTICDCQTAEGTISSKNSDDGIIYNRGTLTINAGSVIYTGSEEYAYSIYNSGGQTTVNGGHIDGIIENYATFTLEGGKITNSGEYSAIQNSDGVVIVNGGSIENDYLGIFNYCGKLYVSGGSITSTESAAISNYDGYTYIYGAPVISGNEENYADIVQHYSDYALVYAQSKDGVTAYTGEVLTVAFDDDESYEVGNIAIAGVNSATASKFILVGNDRYLLKQGTGDNADKLLVALSHEHSWQYEANGATVTATCVGEGTCEYEADNKQITILAPGVKYYTDNGEFAATLSADSLAGQEQLPTIYYVGRGNTQYEESTVAPTNPGAYTAYITVGSATAKVDYMLERKVENEVKGYIYINEDYHALMVGNRFLLMPHNDKGTGYCETCHAEIIATVE